MHAVILFVGGIFSRLAGIFVVPGFGYDPPEARILRKRISGTGPGILLVAILILILKDAPTIQYWTTPTGNEPQRGRLLDDHTGR